jgi:hypothetical protein
MPDTLNSHSAVTAAVDTQGNITLLQNNVPDIFINHRLQKKHENAVIPSQHNPDWLTISLILIIALFTWYKIFYHRMFMQLVNAFFSTATTNQIVRDESVLLQRASLNASVISYLVGGLFLYQLSIYYHWEHPLLGNGIVRFLIFAMGIAIVYSAKMIALRFLSNVFNAEKPASAYIFTIFLFNMMAGLTLLPVVVLMAYAPASIHFAVISIVAVILLAMLCYRLIRAVQIWLSIHRAPLFYLFLYLCAFEVAPLMLIRKVIMMQT